VQHLIPNHAHAYNLHVQVAGTRMASAVGHLTQSERTRASKLAQECAEVKQRTEALQRADLARRRLLAELTTLAATHGREGGASERSGQRTDIMAYLAKLETALCGGHQQGPQVLLQQR
jgi:hypothetical protein